MDIISRYTRAQAIADGVLIDVSDTAKEAGFVFSVVVTAAVWAECVTVPSHLAGHQDQNGRLWDVLWMLRDAIARQPDDAPKDVVYFQVAVQRSEGNSELVQLWSQCGPGDAGEPVLTVMMRGED